MEITKDNLVVAFEFPNGHFDQSVDTYGWLRHYGYRPEWGDYVDDAGKPGRTLLLPENEIERAKDLVALHDDDITPPKKSQLCWRTWK